MIHYHHLHCCHLMLLLIIITNIIIYQSSINHHCYSSITVTIYPSMTKAPMLITMTCRIIDIIADVLILIGICCNDYQHFYKITVMVLFYTVSAKACCWIGFILILEISPNLLHVPLLDLGSVVWPWLTSFGISIHIFIKLSHQMPQQQYLLYY